MTSTPWYITQARDAHAMGHRYIGAKLNVVLAQTAPGVVVRCDPLRPEDSMRVAMDMYRRALSGLRTRMNLPTQDHKIAPWTLGYVNDSNNLPFNIDLGVDWQSCEATVFEFLRSNPANWTPEQWRELIVVPVEAQFVAVNRELDVVEARLSQEIAPLVNISNGPSSLAKQSMAEVKLQAAKLANTDLSILILGETGTGKEHLAKDIHRSSPRANKPFVPVNCASLPKERIEAELFGYVKGAFTGADRDFEGRVREADAGTIFLDEIGDLPTDCWPNTLRFLQDREIQPLGGHRSQVDVRVLAATSRSEQIPIDARHRFDHILQIPPLRMRREEIVELAGEFFEQAKTDHELKSIRFPQEERDALAKADHAWPGNIRELKKAIGIAVALHSGDRNLTAAEVLAQAKDNPGLA